MFERVNERTVIEVAVRRILMVEFEIEINLLL